MPLVHLLPSLTIQHSIDIFFPMWRQEYRWRWYTCHQLAKRATRNLLISDLLDNFEDRYRRVQLMGNTVLMYCRRRLESSLGRIHLNRGMKLNRTTPWYTNNPKEKKQNSFIHTANIQPSRRRRRRCYNVNGFLNKLKQNLRIFFWEIIV